MNSLNILTRSRSNSISDPDSLPESTRPDYNEQHSGASTKEKQDSGIVKDKDQHDGQEDGREHILLDEKSPLLGKSAEDAAKESSQSKQGWRIHRRIAEIMINSVRVVIATITAPGRYFLACFYDEDGHFSAILPLRRLGDLLSRQKRKSAAAAVGLTIPPADGLLSRDLRLERRHVKQPSTISIASTSSSMSEDGDADHEKGEDSPARHTRSRTAQSIQHQPPDSRENRKSIRIQVQEDALRRRKRHSKRLSTAANPDDVATVASALKSPSSPSVSGSKLTRYPRFPAPPRPIVPRRQPSYSLTYSTEGPRKTLIIDLDETLIHSMAKGGRMSTGHMVEVRLGGPVSSSGVSIGPGVPILYFVHERPGCHEFLRKVCRWYNLVVFTASVQEYADPVIDWLERERKYFSRRYYRQHCTFRNGAYIKDLAQVEPDLSRVMILDNSPMSYVFHEDNAIPIEGWISDPTDNDLLYLVPLLEGLQYVTDVRALLALRQGQAQQA